MASEESLRLAGQVWCKESTKHIVMNPVLAAEFAELIDTLKGNGRKFCVDCHWHRRLLLGGHGCYAPRARMPDSGKMSSYSCIQLRSVAYLCDEEAKWFIAKNGPNSQQIKG